jgi:hypothetical protein
MNMVTTKLFFPIWMMFVVPVSWAAIIPGTFLIAFFGLLASLYIIRSGAFPRGDRLRAAWEGAKKGMWRAWLNLCAAYAVGTALMLAPALLTPGMPETGFVRQAALAVTENIYQNALSVLWATLCVAGSAGISYLLNRGWTFRGMEGADARHAALWLAFLTAPYLFFSTYRLFY